jgi:hypothetical protein
MKGRFIAGLLAIALGLAGCGSPESTEAIVTTANTTAKTIEMSTFAETTTAAITTIAFDTTQPETTPPQTTTISETAPPVIYNDDEQTLKNLITEKTDKELLLWEYGDFDNDGAFEAFAFPGVIDEYDQKSGTLYLVNSSGLNKIQGETYGVDVFTFTFDEDTFAAMVFYGTNDYSRIWGVNGKEAYEPPISRIGQQFTVDENGEMTITQSAFDNFTMSDDNINGAHTWKPYYFYYDNGFREHGGSQILLDELLTYENAEKYVDEIKNLNGEITNILKRGNGIIHINYRIPDPEVDYLKWNYYYTLKITDEKVTHMTDNPDKPEWDNGVYLLALLPEIAVYSGMLYPVYQDGSYDYIDKTGKVIIDGNFDTAEYFSEGLGIVSKDGKYGAVNSNGDLVVPLEYKIIGDFNDSAAYIVDENDRLGYVDNTGEIFIEISYPVIMDPYVRINNFSEGLCIIHTSRDECICIDKTGKVIFDNSAVKFDINSYFSEGYMQYFIEKEDGTKLFGFLNTNGEIAIEAQFDAIRRDFSGGISLVELDGKLSYINKQGEIIYEFDKPDEVT